MKKIFLIIIFVFSFFITLNVCALDYNKFSNGIMLDVARRYYTVDEIKAYIDYLSGYDNSFIQIHFTDDESVDIECRYLDQTKEGAIVSNGEYINPNTNKKFLTYDQIKYLMDYSKSKKVEFIPEIDVPSHMNSFKELSRIKFGEEYTNNMFRGSGEEYNNIDIVQPESKDFILSLYDEYTDFFKDCNYFVLGFDEYTYRIDEKIPFINEMNRYLNEKGFITRIWNDSITKNNMTGLDKNIEILYWVQIDDSYASMNDLKESGINVINCNSYYLFFVPNDRNTNQHDLDYTINDIINNWTIDIFNNTNYFDLENYDNVIGGMISSWGEFSLNISSSLVYNQTTRMFNAMNSKIKGYNVSIENNNGIINSKLYKLKGGETVPFTRIADLGYTFNNLSVKDSDNNIVITDGDSFITPNSDVTIVGDFKAIPYKFVDGFNQSFNGESLVFKMDGPLELFDKLYLNDQVIDKNDYSLESGSTIIILKKEYLNGLKFGDYNLKAIYKNGSSDIIQFSVKTDNPNTFTNYKNNILFITSILLLCFGMIKLLKKNVE